MPGVTRSFAVRIPLPLLVFTLGLFGCSSSRPSAVKSAPSLSASSATAVPAPPREEKIFPVMLGIDVLEADVFAILKGKRVGLLTHPAGVNRRGESTIEVLRRAPGVKLVALYAVEHGIYNELPAEKI